jgi:hypothetical protein
LVSPFFFTSFFSLSQLILAMLKCPTRHSFYDEAKCNEKRREETGRERGEGKQKAADRRRATLSIVSGIIIYSIFRLLFLFRTCFVAITNRGATRHACL